VNPDDVDDSILQKQLVKAIPSEEGRLCWQWRLAGYEVQEIATALNISADCLSTRMRRAAKQAARILNLGRKRQ
jgi:DNA-directed RNA polymerase specialized sigma24 family protein